ncbi:MAG TPA: hypothetical protein VHB30_04305, partial [Solirubrobacteraceae bacterium]|nr:hypothetical protein [Solirubrobacteraceae bacterium]
NIHRVEIDLSDASDPTFAQAPSDGLFDTTRTLGGSEQVAFRAADTGGGVATASVLVDGVELDRRVVDDNGGACAEPYTLRAPCKAAVDAAYAFDTTQLADGAHAVSLVVRDATGVNQVAYGPVSVTVDNSAPASPSASPGPGPAQVIGAPLPAIALPTLAPLPTAPRVVPAPKTTTSTANGTNASAHAKLPGAERQRTIGAGSATVIRGRLVDAKGRPIAHARLDVRARVRMTGATTKTIAHVTTTSTGAYSYRLPPGPSREVTFAYKARTTDRRYAVTRRIVVYVKAAVRLSRSATKLRNGQVLTLTAHAVGQSIRRRATTIAFEVRIGTSWRTFATASIDAHGVARARHRFRYTTAAVTYRFRARTTRNAAFPYLPGTSPVRSVLVRP